MGSASVLGFSSRSSASTISAATVMPAARRRSAKAWSVKPVGSWIGIRAVPRYPRRDRPLDLNLVGPDGSPNADRVVAPPPACGQAVLDRDVARRVRLHRRRLIGARPRDVERDEVVAEREAARALRPVLGGDIVDVPAAGVGLVVGRVVVADEPALDAVDAERPKLPRPLVEGVRRGEEAAECRVARAAQDEVAAQRRVAGRTAGGAVEVELGDVAEVRPERVERRRGRDELQVRGRHQVLVGVLAHDDLAGLEVLDVEPPEGVGQVLVGERGRDGVADRRIGRARRRFERAVLGPEREGSDGEEDEGESGEAHG